MSGSEAEGDAAQGRNFFALAEWCCSQAGNRAPGPPQNYAMTWSFIWDTTQEKGGAGVVSGHRQPQGRAQPLGGSPSQGMGERGQPCAVPLPA